jgi:hypothetical protein
MALYLHLKDETIWINRLACEWPKYDLKSCLEHFKARSGQLAGESDAEAINSRPAYSLYKMRWIALGNPHMEHKGDYSIRQILVDEMTESIEKTLHIILLPLKFFGVLTLPIYWICKNKQTRANTPSLACLRCTLTD